MSTKCKIYCAFREVFLENIAKRSRTANGVSDTGSNTKKKKLLLEGEALAQKVYENTEELIKNVWDSAVAFSREPLVALSAKKVRKIMENWYDIVNKDLQDPKAYCESLSWLTAESEKLRLKYGRNYRVNPRYRTWNIPYATLKIEPIELEFYMDEFYSDLCKKINDAVINNNLARLLAFADLMLDGEIHPWNDGCGRIATATVMWLSVVVCHYKWPSRIIVPSFDTREVHYLSNHDLEGHSKYFSRCLVVI